MSGKGPNASEEHRTLAIDAVCVALATTCTTERRRPAAAYRELAESIVDHLTAHAVEVLRDLIAAQRRLHPEVRGGFAKLVGDTQAELAQAAALQKDLERLDR